MATYNSFEDLPVWKQAAQLAELVYKHTHSGNLNKDFGLKDQIQRAAISVSSNIAEGFERGTRPEFIQFLYIARGSCGELRSQLSIAQNIGFITAENGKQIYEMCKKVSSQINGFIEYLKISNVSGQKFQNKRDRDREEFMKYLKSITDNKAKT